MKLSKVLICLSLFVVAALPLAAQTQAHITGQVFKRKAPGTISLDTSNFVRIRFCDVTLPNGYKNQGFCSTATNLGNGNYEVWLNANASYYIFAWDDGDRWGSQNAPSYYWSVFGLVYNTVKFYGDATGVNVLMDPRPLDPTPVLPANNEAHSSVNPILKWSDGLNADRTWSFYTITYDIVSLDIYGRPNTILSNLTCNSDGAGYCTYQLNSLYQNAPYNWSVVAKLRSPQSLAKNPYNSNESSRSYFTTAIDAQHPPKINLTAADSTHHLVGCGPMTADGVSGSVCEQFTIIDVNGGDLNDGDAVYIVDYYDSYLTAPDGPGGPGSLTFVRTTPGPAQTFTIRKMWGSTGSRIIHMDRLALRTYRNDYIQADNGGGTTTSADTPDANPWNTFGYFVAGP